MRFWREYWSNVKAIFVAIGTLIVVFAPMVLSAVLNRGWPLFALMLTVPFGVAVFDYYD